MSELFNDFEKRHTQSWFASGWVEVDVKPQVARPARKNLAELESELQKLSDDIENITQRQLRLSNLAKLYDS